MQSRFWPAIIGVTLGTAGLGGLRLAYREKPAEEIKEIPNPNEEAFLDFANRELRAGKRNFAPWVTSNAADLALLNKHFKHFKLPQVEVARENQPVHIQSLQQESRVLELLALNQQSHDEYLAPILTRMGFWHGLDKSDRLQARQSYQMNSDQAPVYVSVGGPAAAVNAYLQASAGKTVLYVNNNSNQATWSGSSYYPKRSSHLPAEVYSINHLSPAFLYQQFKAYQKPARFTKEVLLPDFPQWNINFEAWLKNPSQWQAGLRFLYGHYRFRHSKLGEAEAAPQQFVENLNEELNILRAPRGSLLVARTAQSGKALLSDANAADVQAQGLRAISDDEAVDKYGIYPRASFGLMENKSDFILKPQFDSKISAAIKAQGGTVVTNWRLTRVLVDANNNEGGILEFAEQTADGNTIYHQRQFKEAYLALGSTPIYPNPYPMVSITGISINALILGVSLKGCPIYSGANVLPFTQPKRVDVGDKANDEMDITDVNVVRITGGASVGPAYRGADRYSYDGQQLVNLYEQVKITLPNRAKLKIVSVTGCDQQVGVNGEPEVFHPEVVVGSRKKSIEAVTIQVGTASSGIVALLACPKRLLSNNTSTLFQGATRKDRETGEKTEPKVETFMRP